MSKHFVAVALAVLAVSSPVASMPASAGAEVKSLHILLTNDDGIDASGLQAQKVALRAAGHRVTVVAPAENQSGSSASMTFGPIRVREKGEEEWAADASPASCALLGLGAFADPKDPFDLVVSGTNHGANLGPAANISGTVGATTAVAAFAAGLPALAVSTDLPEGDEARHDQHMAEVAAFTVRLVAKLRDGGDGLLPRGIRLNVNYPALAAADVRGVKVVAQGTLLPFSLSYEKKAEGLYGPTFARAEKGADGAAPNGDVAAFMAGQVAITPLDTSWAAPTAATAELGQRLDGLTARP